MWAIKTGHFGAKPATYLNKDVRHLIWTLCAPNIYYDNSVLHYIQNPDIFPLQMMHVQSYTMNRRCPNSVMLCQTSLNPKYRKSLRCSKFSYIDRLTTTPYMCTRCIEDNQCVVCKDKGIAATMAQCVLMTDEDQRCDLCKEQAPYVSKPFTIF